MKQTHRTIAGVSRHLYGWTPNRPDPRDASADHRFAAQAPFHPSASFSLRSSLAVVPVYDQKQEGSCVLNALCRAQRALCVKLGLKVPDLARQFAYWTTRVKMGDRPPPLPRACGV